MRTLTRAGAAAPAAGAAGAGAGAPAAVGAAGAAAGGAAGWLAGAAAGDAQAASRSASSGYASRSPKRALTGILISLLAGAGWQDWATARNACRPGRASFEARTAPRTEARQIDAPGRTARARPRGQRRWRSPRWRRRPMARFAEAGY